MPDLSLELEKEGFTHGPITDIRVQNFFLKTKDYLVTHPIANTQTFTRLVRAFLRVNRTKHGQQHFSKTLSLYVLCERQKNITFTFATRRAKKMNKKSFHRSIKHSTWDLNAKVFPGTVDQTAKRQSGVGGDPSHGIYNKRIEFIPTPGLSLP